MSTVETPVPSALVRTIFDRLNDHDADALSQYAAEEVVEDWPVVGRLSGIEAVRDHFAATFAAMPDFHIEIERMAADGETVFVHWRVTGTFSGAPFQGIAATGHPIDLRGTDCFTIHDGKIVANFIAYDGMTFAVQAGVLPPHGSPLDRAMVFMTNLMTRARRRLRR